MQKEQEIIKEKDKIDPIEFADWDEGKLSTNKVYQKLKLDFSFMWCLCLLASDDKPVKACRRKACDDVEGKAVRSEPDAEKE